ncbi:hypothetical protein GGD88_003442 [Roseospira goensis]|uniref:Uncharacterized protein n=1 Tax=Roseospira goensis TaxID=391922 RepID=A0A7W6WMN6_9PROT|nr:hypothetical protein [Roseospira goensis]
MESLSVGVSQRLPEGFIMASPNATSASPLSLSDLDTTANEPRILDVRIGERLGMAQPLNIRKTIESNVDELRRYGPIHAAREKVQIGSGAIREISAYHLNEGQTLLLCMLSRTARAADVRQEVIEVFMAWRRGQIPPPPARPAGLDIAAIAARDSRIANLEHREAQLLAIIERLSGSLAAPRASAPTPSPRSHSDAIRSPMRGPMRGCRLTDEVVAEARNLIDQGLIDRAVANRIGISRSSVRRIRVGLWPNRDKPRGGSHA